MARRNYCSGMKYGKSSRPQNAIEWWASANKGVWGEENPPSDGKRDRHGDRWLRLEAILGEETFPANRGAKTYPAKNPGRRGLT